MKKNLLRELTLPAFWVFFFIASSKSEVKVDHVKKPGNTELQKTDVITSGTTNIKDKNKSSISAKAIYLSQF